MVEGKPKVTSQLRFCVFGLVPSVFFFFFFCELVLRHLNSILSVNTFLTAARQDYEDCVR